MQTVLDVLDQIWSAATSPADLPDLRLVLVTAGIALLAVAWRPSWSVVRHGVTTVHEAGHAVVALLTGRQLQGIRVHSDTSGLTLSKGRPRGPGMWAMTFAGYTAPALVGLAAAFGLSRGYAVGVLWALVVLAVFVLVMIRNWYGLWTVLVTLVLLVAVTWWGSDGLRLGAAYTVVWLLLLGAPRAVVELWSQRRRGRAAGSDADVLGRLTHTPGALWVLVFALVTVATLAQGARWLAPTLLP